MAASGVAIRRRPRLAPSALTDPRAAAQAAGLRYVSDDMPGIRRRRSGKGFRYLTPEGASVSDPAELIRVRALAIPPAWSDVWIAPIANGHIQATGRDGRGRKQYRYHARWREVRDESKYGRMIAFGTALPRLRERVSRDVSVPGLPKEKVVATVVRLLGSTLIRVGNDEYARTNGSFGLTTMRSRHVDVTGTQLRFRFRGKSGVTHTVGVRDKRLARVVQRCQELPGAELFQYEGEDSVYRPIDSTDVNDYLRDACGDAFTAKDFRTWAGTVLAAETLAAALPCETETQRKQAINRAIEAVAKRLGNTPAVCRSCYVHPAVIEAYQEGELPEIPTTDTPPSHGLTPTEAAVLALLQARAE